MTSLVIKFLLDSALKIFFLLKEVGKKIFLVIVIVSILSVWIYSFHIQNPLKVIENRLWFKKMTSELLRECGPGTAILTMNVGIEHDYRGYYKARFRSGLANGLDSVGGYMEQDLMATYPACYGAERSLDFNTYELGSKADGKSFTVLLRNSYGQDISSLDYYPELQKMLKCSLWYKNKEFDKLSYTSILSVTNKLIWVIFVSKSINSNPENYCDLETIAISVRNLIKQGIEP